LNDQILSFGRERFLRLEILMQSECRKGDVLDKIERYSFVNTFPSIVARASISLPLSSKLLPVGSKKGTAGSGSVLAGSKFGTQSTELVTEGTKSLPRGRKSRPRGSKFRPCPLGYPQYPQGRGVKNPRKIDWFRGF
jgi:hypothetical protein